MFVVFTCVNLPEVPNAKGDVSSIFKMYKIVGCLLLVASKMCLDFVSYCSLW